MGFENPDDLAEVTPNVGESIQVGGDIIVDEVYITSVNGEFDIKNFCITIELFEDVFSNVLMGQILVADAASLVSKLPIVGGELLTISARTPTFASTEAQAIKRTFVIYSLTERFLNKDSEQIYILKFISPEGIVDNEITVSKAFSGSTDSIVDEVFSKYLASARYVRDGKISSQKTGVIYFNRPNRTSVKLVSPFWTPLKIINWVAQRAQSSNGKAPNFLFFETNKQFYFASIEEIIGIQMNNNTLFGEYFFGDSAVRDTGASQFSYVSPDIGRQYSIIQSANFKHTFDVMRAQDFGYYASKLITHDIVLKRYRELSWDYLVNFKTYAHTDPNPPFGSTTLRNPDTHRAFRSKQYMMFEEYPDNKVDQWAMQRNSLLYALSDIKLEINVAGRTDIEAGRLIYIHYPRGTDKSETSSDNFDPYLSGVYFITAIHHVISLTGKHRMTMEVVRESFGKSLG